jgi:hypothetical protein
MTIRALAACLLLLPLAAQDVDAPRVDYQRIADGARWAFQEEMTDPLACATRGADRYTVVLTSGPENRDRVHIAIRDGQREAYAWDGHQRSVFRIQGDRLYYARFHPSGDGGTIVAVDLASGRERWAVPLQGLGGVEHSAYHALMTIDASDEAVTIWGDESYGRYLEFKDPRTGETIGHRVFAVGYGADRHEVPVAPKR